MATERQRARQLDDNIAAGEKKVRGIVKRSARSVNGAISEYTALSNFLTNAGVRNKLFAELLNEYKALNSRVDDWVNSEVKITAKNFWSYAREDLPAKNLGAAATFGKFSDKYVADIVGMINPSTVSQTVAMNAHLGGMLTNDIRAIRAAVSTTMAEGAVEGLNNKQMTERMVAKVSSGTAGSFQFVDRAGRAWQAATYFAMLNRTLHSTAARQSYIDTATKELGYDLYTIEGGVTGSSLDNPNDPCDQWSGRIISMTGATKSYPTYDDAVADGVFHPNCVHFVRAILPSDMPEAREQQAKERKQARELEAA